jgi:hypothetical protein
MYPADTYQAPALSENLEQSIPPIEIEAQTKLNSREAAVLSDIQKALHAWYNCFIYWAITHYFLGISSTVCAVIAASTPEFTGRNYLLSYVAVSTAILTFLKAQQKNTAYINAWRNLRAERMAYSAGETELKSLVKCYKDGEEMIGKCD